MKTGRVLIVDDQFLIVEFLRLWVETLGFEVCATANTAAGALDLALRLRPDVVLMDLHLAGGGDGVAAACAILASLPTRIVYCTGSGDPATIQRLNANHASAILAKPIDPAELARILAAL
ncbi:MAG: response regulator [Alphaproteobacteria bacterium]|nr:response regulator [Alphaproteobacteria bacterium]